MPSVIEQDFAGFSIAVGKLQATMSDYFSSAQGGAASEKGARKILQYLRKQGIKGTGQTSWGPIIFAIMKNDKQALILKTQLKQWMQSEIETDDSCLAGSRREILIVQADNQGAVIRTGNTGEC